MPAATPTPRRVLIVGAGVVGLLTAMECARRGDEVTVVDQGPIPNPAAGSFDQHRVVRALHPADPQATRAGADLHRRWTHLERHLATPLYRRIGVLLVQPLADAAANLRLMRAAGVDAELLVPRQLRQRLTHLTFPPQAVGLLEPEAGVLLAHRVLTETTRWLRQHGTVRLLPHHAVIEVDPDAAAITLADGSTLAGDLLFVAAGAWSRSLLAGLLPTPLTLYRQSVLYRRPDPAEPTAWCSTPVVMLRTGPHAGGWLVPPGAGTDLKVSTHAVCRPVERIGSRRTSPSRRRTLEHLLRSIVAIAAAPAPTQTDDCYYLAERSTGGAVLTRLGHSSSPTWAYVACGGGGFKTAPLIAHQVAGLRAPSPRQPARSHPVGRSPRLGGAPDTAPRHPGSDPRPVRTSRGARTSPEGSNMDPQNGILLVIGSGLSAYREYLLSSASRRARAAGYDLWLINGTTATWQRPYVCGVTVTNVHDHDNLAATARKLAATRPVVGVLCWDEPLVLPSAMIAAEFDLPGLSTDGVLGCRDKHRTRRLLRAAGLAQPAHGYATSVEQARTLAASIGYPVVVKPRALGASIGVVLATDQAQLDTAYRVAVEASLAGDQPYQGGALIEEYLDGPEISVDAAVVDGDYLPMYLARKQTGLEPYFEEIGHVVDAADPLLTEPALHELLAATHRALGIGFGMTHTEVKLTRRGPMIVEVNGRLGGDLIPYLGKLATGIDPGEVMVDVATGVRPQLTADHRTVAGIRFGYPPYDCRVTALSVPQPDASAGIVTSAAMVEPGTELRLPPGGYIARHSFVVCTAADADTCATRLRQAIDQVCLEAEPLAPPPAGTPFQMPAGLLDVEDDGSPQPPIDTVREQR